MSEKRYVADVRIRKNPDGETQLTAFDQNGKRWPECDYFTDDADDVRETRAAMLSAGKRIRDNGFSVQ